MRRLETYLAYIMIVGMIMASLFVLLGGSIFLWQHGAADLQKKLILSESKDLTIYQLFKQAFSFTPLGTILIGLIILVLTQLLRVILLLGYYLHIRDKWFACISAFIAFMLIYSFLSPGF